MKKHVLVWNWLLWAVQMDLDTQHIKGLIWRQACCALFQDAGGSGNVRKHPKTIKSFNIYMSEPEPASRKKKGWVSRWTSASETMLRQPSTINYASVSMLLKPCFRNYILGNHVLATKRKLCCRKRRRLSATSKTTQTTWKINVTPRAQLLERQGCKLRTTIACRALGGGGLKHDLESWWELMEGQSWIEEHHCAQGFGGTFKKWLGIVMRTHGRTKLNWGTPLRAGLWGEV